jgi:hypothetical protein
MTGLWFKIRQLTDVCHCNLQQYFPRNRHRALQLSDCGRYGMASDGESASVELASIKRDFPGWRPWRSDSGQWYATRTGDVTPPEESSDWWAMTVFSATADGLRVALRMQEGRRQAVTNGRAACAALRLGDVS